ARNYATSRARAARRSACVHAAVRQCPGGGAGARGRGRGGRDVSVPVRRAAGGGRLPARRTVLPALVEDLQAVAPPAAAEGSRARRGDALAVAGTPRRAPSAMARAAAGRRPPALPRAVRVHLARSAAPPDRVPARPLAAIVRAVRPGRRPQ